MKKFKITASYVTYCTLIVNAHNEDEAWAIALDTDGGDLDFPRCSRQLGPMIGLPTVQ